MQQWEKLWPGTLVTARISSFLKRKTAASPPKTASQTRAISPAFLPNFLADRGAQVIIAGGMGGGAVEIFNERGVEVIIGAQGDAGAAVEAYLEGRLKSTGSICHEHEHQGECGE